MPTYQQNTAGSDVLPEASYSFEVKNAEDATSNNGNEMIKLTLLVNDYVEIVDHLVFTRNAYWKIDQFRLATGETLGAPGSNVSLEAEDCIMRKGLVSVTIETWEGRKRNKVGEYLDPRTNKIEPQPAPRAKRPIAVDLKPEPKDIPF